MSTKPKILVADDSVTIQKIIRLALTSANVTPKFGMEIISAHSGPEALDMIRKERPDIVLIDVALPVQNAFEIIRATRADSELTGTKFILMSSAFEKIPTSQETLAMADAELTKPFDPSVLRSTIASLQSANPQPTHQAQVTSPPTQDITHDQPPDLMPLPEIPQPQSVQHSLPDLPSPNFPSPDLPPMELGSPLPELPPLPDLPNLPDLPPLTLETTDGSSGGESISLEPPTPAEVSNHADVEQASPVEDIKILTQSTLEMSGFHDDFEWSVQETLQAPLQAPLQPALQAQGLAPDRKQAPSPLPDVFPPLPDPTGTGDDTLASKLPASLLNGAVERELRETLEKLARSILPDLAEKVIKEEIHRMLDEKR